MAELTISCICHMDVLVCVWRDGGDYNIHIRAHSLTFCLFWIYWNCLNTFDVHFEEFMFQFMQNEQTIHQHKLRGAEGNRDDTYCIFLLPRLSRLEWKSIWCEPIPFRIHMRWALSEWVSKWVNMKFDYISMRNSIEAQIVNEIRNRNKISVENACAEIPFWPNHIPDSINTKYIYICQLAIAHLVWWKCIINWNMRATSFVFRVCLSACIYTMYSDVWMPKVSVWLYSLIQHSSLKCYKHEHISLWMGLCRSGGAWPRKIINYLINKNYEKTD